MSVKTNPRRAAGPRMLADPNASVLDHAFRASRVSRMAAFGILAEHFAMPASAAQEAMETARVKGWARADVRSWRIVVTRNGEHYTVTGD